MAYSGKFFPTNTSKYKGDINNITWRSLWERNVMVKLDTWDSILEWSSEELIIPYRSIDGKIHRYFPDFAVKMKTKDGKIVNALIEVKPKKQVEGPKPRKKVTKAYIKEIMEFGKNTAKWTAAEAYCKDKGWEFIKLTEDDLFKKTDK